MSAAPISVVVVVAGRIAPAWAQRVIDSVRDAPFADLLGVVEAATDTGSPAPGAGPRLLDAIERADRSVSRAGNDALGPRDLGRLPPLGAGPRADLLVDLSPDGVAAAPAAAAAARVWRLQHPGGAGLGAATAAFRALSAGDGPLVTELVESAPDAGRVLYRSTATVWPRSLYRTRNAACWKSAHFVVRCLAVAAREGWDAEPQPGGPATGPASPSPTASAPGTAEVAAWAARTLRDAVRGAVAARRQPGHWLVALRAAADGGTPDGFTGAREVHGPADGDLADPFLHGDGERVHLFAEEVRPGEERGVISCRDVGPDGSVGPGRVVLAEPFHLSYPQVFAHAGRIYMLPETSQAGDVRLYVATDYPDRWRLDRVLLEDTVAYDATLLAHDGRLWLFAVVPVAGGSDTDELAVFHADRLEGPWRAHARNPVVSDASRARPAGRVLRVDGALVRPAQDCSRDYGLAVTFQRIDVLTPDDYRESTVGRLDAGWGEGSLRTHTFNRAAGFEAADAYRR